MKRELPSLPISRIPPASPAKRSFAESWLANTLERSGTHDIAPDVDARKPSEEIPKVLGISLHRSFFPWEVLCRQTEALEKHPARQSQGVELIHNEQDNSTKTLSRIKIDR